MKFFGSILVTPSDPMNSNMLNSLADAYGCGSYGISQNLFFVFEFNKEFMRGGSWED